MAQGRGDGGVGNLLIGRFKGQGIYVGRGVRVTVANLAANGATVHVETPMGIAISDSDIPMEDHLAAVGREEKRVGSRNRVLGTVSRDYVLLVGAGIFIGRGLEVTLVAINTDGPRGSKAQIAVEAPQWMAVSRDDFTLEDHMHYQQEREKASRR